jgi:hypothetical protein
MSVTVEDDRVYEGWVRGRRWDQYHISGSGMTHSGPSRLQITREHSPKSHPSSPVLGIESIDKD